MLEKSHVQISDRTLVTVDLGYKSLENKLKRCDVPINNPDSSVGVCCSHKVVAVGFNTLRYDAIVGVLKPPHE